MNDSTQPTKDHGRIPVLFDVVERGKNAPVENKIKPPPPKEKTDFSLDSMEHGSEDPTVIPGTENPKTDSFALTDMNEITQESPIVKAVIPEGEKAIFNLDELDDKTDEIPTIPPTMLNDLQPEDNLLVEQALQEIMPELEKLARDKLIQLVKTANKKKGSA